MSGHGASAEAADSTAASARCKVRSVGNSRAWAATCHSRPADMPNSPGLYHTWWLLVGAFWWWCIMVRYRRCTWQFGSPRYDTPSPPPQSSSLWPAMYSFVRLSMSLVFGLKMHLASAYCTTAMDCYCLPTAPQSWYIQPKYPSILVAILAAIQVWCIFQLLCMPVHLPIFLLI